LKIWWRLQFGSGAADKQGNVGIGVKIGAGRHLRVRFEVSDDISAQPDKVIAASAGFQPGGRVMRDILGLAALSVTW
jgi:hypothetical protein